MLIIEKSELKTGKKMDKLKSELKKEIKNVDKKINNLRCAAVLQ